MNEHKQSCSTTLQGNRRGTVGIPLQERVCYLAVISAVGWQCLTTMPESVNKDYILTGLFCRFLHEECSRGNRFGISAHSESPIVGYFAPKSPWPDRNLTDLYLSLRLSLFFEGGSGLQPEGFCPT